MSVLRPTESPEQAMGGVTSGGCLACGAPEVQPLADLGSVPTQCTALWPDAESARQVPVGRIRLVSCSICGSVSNAEFDPALVPYDARYENSQFFSPRFGVYATTLAQRLVHDYGLRNRHVVEVGSGKGEFLSALSQAGVGRVTGFDPSYRGESDDVALRAVTIVPEPFRAGLVAEPAAVVCRHVLEHLVDPVGFLADLCAAMDDTSSVLYLEVPNRKATFTGSGLWDVIYQHCTYFDAHSLAWVARRAGFEVLRAGTAFDDQFLFLEAIPTRSTAPSPPSPAAVNEDARAFAALYDQVTAYWGGRLGRWSREGRRVGLWGAGAKGVTFLNVLDGDAVCLVIDVNPRKQGHFVAGTGHLVAAPAALVETPVDEVIVMNGSYLDEIADEMAGLGVRPRLTAV